MSIFDEKDNALKFLQEQNEKQMAALPDELQQVLRTLPADHAARWLSENLGKYQQAAPTEKGVLSESQKQIAASAGMSEDEYLELVKKHTPGIYEQMPKTLVSTQEPPPRQLTEQEREVARLAGMSEEEYLKYSDRKMPIERK